MSQRPEWRAYELTKQLGRNLRFFWPRAESRIYEVAKQLVDLGLAESERVHSAGGRPRTTYRISPAGRRALRRWARSEPQATTLECDALLRLFLADHARRQDLQMATDQLRADAAAILAVGRTVAEEYIAGVSPSQDQVRSRALVFDFLSRFAMFLDDFADRADTMVDGWETHDRAEIDRSAVAHIAQVRTLYPSR